ENAVKKALHYGPHAPGLLFADDSGLEVDALGGAPGVYSARYSGPQATDEANNRRLLEELGDAPRERRAAHYVCHAALADPRGDIRATAEGRCHGRILFAPRGTGGFGYDP